MTNLKTQLRLTSLLSLILLACTAAYGQITPLGDTYTNSADPTTNYGAQKTLDVDAAKEITYIQFNLSSIPTGASVSQATLKLYVNTVATAGAFEVYAVNGTWSESTLTYSLAPALGSVIDSNVPITTADKNQYILIPMTATVQGWVNTPSTNYGIALVAVGSFNATFDSKETTTTSHPAELDVVFAGDGTITGVTTASGSGLTGGGTSGTLNLSMTNACAANQVLQWNGSAWICAAVGTGTITGVTAGTDLSGGGTSGNVTLNLNTAALNAVYAQLGAANTFTTTQTINGTVTATAAGNGVAGIATGTTGDTIGVLGTSAGSTGSGVYGIATNTAGTGAGVYGQSSSPTGYGLSGTNNATTGNPVGVFGLTSSPLGAGVFGENGATTGAAPGVIGESSSNAGFGVAGSDPNSVGVYGAGINGVLGETPSTSGSGVEGVASATTGTTFGVSGTASSPNGYGVFGANTSSAISLNGLALGVYGTTTATSGAGVEGSATATTGTTVGVFGTTSSTSGIGVLGNEEATTGSTTGVWGMASSTTGVGVFGSGATGVFGSGSASYGGKFVSEGAAALYAENNTTTAGAELFYAWMPNFPTDAAAIIGDPGCDEDSGNMALQLGQTSMSSCTNYTLVGNISGATYLNANSGQSLNLRVGNGEVVQVAAGAVIITGTLSATGTKNFLIDDPLDPANKYLTHAAIESSEVLNLYTGNAILDDSGAAVVQLPDWFEAINKDFRYQLTAVGAPGRDLYVKEKVNHNHFVIAGGQPRSEVSWQVTGVRNDAWEKAHPMVVEADKGADRGRYLTPELYGAPETARIGNGFPPASEQVAQHRSALPLRRNASALQQRAPLSLPTPPMPALPKVAPLPHAALFPHAAAQVSKPEVNQK